jgi:hypothetical protein
MFRAFAAVLPSKKGEKIVTQTRPPGHEGQAGAGVNWKHDGVQLLWLMRFTTTFTITSFSSVRLSAIISVRATSVLSGIRFDPSA